jgi:hypothetical protein
MVVDEAAKKRQRSAFLEAKREDTTVVGCTAGI